MQISTLEKPRYTLSPILMSGEVRVTVDAIENLLVSTTLEDYVKLLAQIDKYWQKQFCDPITVLTPDGGTVML